MASKEQSEQGFAVKVAVGTRVEACDQEQGDWFPAVIVDVDKLSVKVRGLQQPVAGIEYILPWDRIHVLADGPAAVEANPTNGNERYDPDSETYKIGQLVAWCSCLHDEDLDSVLHIADVLSSHA